MILLGDMGQVEPRFGPFGDNVCQVEACFDPFGVVLVSAQDKCTVCAECTIGSEIILTHLMVLVGDVGQVEARFGLFGDSVNLGARWVHGLHQMCHGHGNRFGHTRWYS
jgi:hypothetical protein